LLERRIIRLIRQGVKVDTLAERRLLTIQVYARQTRKYQTRKK